LFKIISESGIAAGVRRIEAITGISVYEHINQLEIESEELSMILKTNRSNLLEKAKSITEEIREKDKEIEKLNNKLSKNIAEDILNSKKNVEGIDLITFKVKDLDMGSLRNLGDEIRNKLGSGIIVLASVLEDKLSFVTMVTKDVNEKGLLAGNIIKEVAKVAGGSGGGRPDMAQAGGKDIYKIDEALALVEKLVREQIKK